MIIDAENTVRLAADALRDKKADDVRIFDMRGRSDVTDYVLIATGAAAPHLKALLVDLQTRLKQAGVRTVRLSGEPDSGWVILDCLDVVIHVLDPQTRAYYALESLWREGPETVREAP